MKHKSSLGWVTGVALCVLLLSACGQAAPPETRAGVWSAATDCGDFTLYISEDGKGITRTDYQVKFTDLGALGASRNKPWRKPFAFEGRELKVEVNALGNLILLSLDAQFSRDGKRLSGTAHFLPQEENGGCKTKFAINR